jgi:hypothetical protein
MQYAERPRDHSGPLFADQLIALTATDRRRSKRSRDIDRRHSWIDVDRIDHAS